jgi:hypothetical protein
MFVVVPSNTELVNRLIQLIAACDLYVNWGLRQAWVVLMYLLRNVVAFNAAAVRELLEFGLFEYIGVKLRRLDD